MFVHIRDNTNQVSCKLQFINVLIFFYKSTKNIIKIVDYDYAIGIACFGKTFECNDRGTCLNEKCYCYHGYTGITCTPE